MINKRITISVKMDIDDLDKIESMVINREFLNKSDCIRKLYKVGYYVMLNKKKVVNTEFADYLKTKLDKNNIIESFHQMKKEDPKLWQALLALEGIEKDHAQQKIIQ
jgi:hypothetical protein|tara:strand:+ start:206 stop:526 length:321 start_codon:yes stop_codon:yes gene_type:complete